MKNIIKDTIYYTLCFIGGIIAALLFGYFTGTIEFI